MPPSASDSFVFHRKRGAPMAFVAATTVLQATILAGCLAGNGPACGDQVVPIRVFFTNSGSTDVEVTFALTDGGGQTLQNGTMYLHPSQQGLTEPLSRASAHLAASADANRRVEGQLNASRCSSTYTVEVTDSALLLYQVLP